MVLDYTFFYVEANIVCIIIFAMMLMREMGSVGRQTKQMIFFNIAISHMLYFVSDIAWVLILNDNIPHTALSASIVNISNAVLLSLITGFWFVYVELSQGETYIGVFKNRMLVMLPAVVETAVQLILFIFFPKTMLDDGHEMTIVYTSFSSLYLPCISL